MENGQRKNLESMSEEEIFRILTEGAGPVKKDDLGKLWLGGPGNYIKCGTIESSRKELDDG